MKRDKLMNGSSKPPAPDLSKIPPAVKLSKDEERTLRAFRQFKVNFANNIFSRLNHPQAPLTDPDHRNRCILDMWSGATISLFIQQHKYGPLMMLQSHIIAQKGEEWLQLIADGDDDDATRTRPPA